MELRNESNNIFTNISSEQYRDYCFGDINYRIVEPLYLSVSKSGGHRVLATNGKCYYIPSGWIAIEWEAKEGQPHFVK